MAILSGEAIAAAVADGSIVIDPFDRCRLNPNSYNIRLAPELLVYRRGILDMARREQTEEMIIPPDGLVLWPGELYLARTMEYTRTDGYVPMLEGRSSIGRLGMFIHITAGFGDVGFDGYWTLEIMVAKPLRVYPGTEIGQIYYHTIEGDTSIRYDGGKYQNNTGVQASMLWKDFLRGKENA